MSTTFASPTWSSSWTKPVLGDSASAWVSGMLAANVPSLWNMCDGASGLT